MNNLPKLDRIFGFVLAFCLFLSACSPIGYPNPDPNPTSGFLQPAQSLQIITNGTGVYEISYRALQKYGWSITDFESIELTDRDKLVPLWMHDNGKDITFRFLVPRSNNPYTQANYFKLTPGVSEAFQHLDGIKFAPEDSIATTDEIHAVLNLEKNLIYEPLFEDSNPWLWLKIPVGGKRKLTLDLPPGISQIQSLRLELWTKSTGQIESSGLITQHYLDVELSSLADQQEFKWSGRGPHTLDLDLGGAGPPNDNLTLSLEIPSASGAADVIYLDAVQLTADYLSKKISAPMYFQGSGSWIMLPPRRELSILALKEGMPIHVNKYPTSLSKENLYYGELGAEYYVFTEQDVKQPDRIEISQLDPKLVDSSQGADYLIIGPGDYEKAAKPLLDLHTSEGLITKYVDVQTVYDQFNDGYPEPQAIRKFLIFAQQTWQTPPRYVLLLGRYTFDPAGNLGSINQNLLPSAFIYTQYGGWTISDSDMVDLDRDGGPDLSTGRIPAADVQQLKDVIAKIQHEEQKIKIHKEAAIEVFLDPSAADFTITASQFNEQASFKGFQTSEIKHRNLLESFDSEQPSLMAYFGHGSLLQLAAPSLLNENDLPSLAVTEQYPVLLAFTCLVGYFAHPQVQSLAELLLVRANSGISAAIAPTTLTLPQNQEILSSEIAKGLGQENSARIGDLLRLAQQTALVNGEADAIDVVRTFVLFGDPAMDLPLVVH
jgi:hypothetical protein